MTFDYQISKIQESLVRTYGLHEHLSSQCPFDTDAKDFYLKLSKYKIYDLKARVRRVPYIQ